MLIAYAASDTLSPGPMPVSGTTVMPARRASASSACCSPDDAGVAAEVHHVRADAGGDARERRD